MTTETTVAIAVPLEAELVDRIRAVDPSVTVLYEPDLLPPERFPADHSGRPRFQAAPPSRRSDTGPCSTRPRSCMACPTKALPAWPGSRAKTRASSGSTAMAAGAGGAVKASGLDAGNPAEVQGDHLRRCPCPAAGRVRCAGNPQRLQAQRRTRPGPGRQGMAGAADPHPAGQRIHPGGHRAGRNRPGNGTDRPRPGHEGQRHQAHRGADRGNRAGLPTTTGWPGCWPPPTP